MADQVTKAQIKAYMLAKMATPNSSGEYPTPAADRVYGNRFGPFQLEELPAIVLFCAEETSEEIDNTQDRRHLKMQVEIQAGGDDADDQLDAISNIIIDLFRDDEYLGGPTNGLAEWCRYSRGQLFYDEKRHLNGMAWVNDFDVRYIWQNVPDTDVSNVQPLDLIDVTTTWDSTAPSPIVPPQTEDLIDIPQS